MRLIFVRHGEPDYDKDCLTKTGIVQAKSAAKRLKNENITAVYSSPMGRAVKTAEFTAKKHGLNVKVLDFMHEITWGDKETSDQSEKLKYDGHPWTLAYELLTKFPDYVGSKNWKDHHYFKDNKCMDCYETISNSFDEFLSGFGLIRKNDLYLCQKPNDDSIALFAHGGSGAIMFSHLLNLPLPFVLTTMPYGVCSVSIISFEAQQGQMIVPRLEIFNDMSHIKNFRKEKLHFAQ